MYDENSLPECTASAPAPAPISCAVTQRQDPSLKNDIDCVLAGGGSPFLGPPPPPPTYSHSVARTAPPPSSTPPLPPPSPPYLGTTGSLPVGAARSTPPPARALGARADNPWGWAAPLEEGEGGGGGEAGVVLEATGVAGTTPPSRDRSWTVPSPYQPLDAKFPTTGCIPEFRLDVGVGVGSGGGGGGRAGYASAAGVAVRGATVAGPGAQATEPAVGAAAGSTVPLGVAAADVVTDVAEGVSVPDESCVASGAARSVGPAAAAAVFATPLPGYLGGGGGGEHEEEMTDDGLGGSAARASPALARARSSEGETFAGDAVKREAGGATGDTGLGAETVVGEERRERAQAPALSPPMMHARGGEYASEEMELAAAIAEVSLEHGIDVGEVRPGGVFQEGGGERHPTGEEKEHRASLLGVASFDQLRLDDGDAVDEWDDDLDPGYMVMAVSEEEFHGQVRGPAGRCLSCFSKGGVLLAICGQGRVVVLASVLQQQSCLSRAVGSCRSISGGQRKGGRQKQEAVPKSPFGS